MNREAVPKIVQTRDGPAASCATNPGDTTQHIERGLHGAAGQPCSVPVHQQQSVLALGKPAVPTQGHVVVQHLGKLGSDRDEAALEELRGPDGQYGVRQIDVGQGEAGRLPIAQPRPVQ